MDFPPRPPPGMIPPGYPHAPPGMPPPHFGAMMHPAGMPPAMMPPRPPYAAQADPRLRMPGADGRLPPGVGGGPPVTVFVGNITEKAQDAMIRHLLNTNGPVNSWKRVQGATGKLQAFGFCEFGNPDAALRAIRILHDWEIADKKLVVKVDAKTKGVLEDFKRKKRKALLGEEKDAKADQDNVKESEYVDSSMKKEDDLTRERIKNIIKEHSKDMNAYINSSDHGGKRSSGAGHRSRSETHSRTDREPRPPGGQPGEHEGEPRLTGPKESLDEVDLEDGKRDIIHREIDKFRETMKIREAEKEAEKQKRDKEKENSNPRDSEPRARGDRDRGDRGSRKDRSDREGSGRATEVIDVDRDQKSRSSNRDRGDTRGDSNRSSESRRGIGGGIGSDRPARRSRSKSFSPVETKRASREGSNKPRERSRISRSRSRSRERRSRSRRPSRSPIRERRDPKDVRRERELEEEDKERKRSERKARDKESSYQERLRKWEGRESKMSRQYENDKTKEIRRKDDEEREGKKLREFLEDYDDDRDDEKYYRGSKLERRLNEREREAAKDAEDRAREKEEIEELRVQILNEGHADPNAELERRMAAMDGKKIIEMVDLEPEHNIIKIEDAGVSPPMTMNDEHTFIPEVIPMDDDESPPPPPPMPVPLPVVDRKQPSGSPPSPTPMPPLEETALPVPAPKPLLQIQPSKKKIDVKDVFNQDDDDGLGMGKKKKLAPLPTSGSGRAKTGNSEKEAGNDSKNSSKSGGGGGKTSSDDKRKHIKSLIDKIPTDKSALFEYNIDWDLVDNQLMEKRIRPWVNKKIAEYIGEPEPTLTDFICSKVLAGSTPKAVLEDVQMVLDEEAEVFVVKMWRLLIYEIENKKLKAATQQSASDI